ncbi:MAG: hypothetical protein KC503_42070 [Myxococcales bacterium]|nr:hypothetical protein [Myxococcales bacterium]
MRASATAYRLNLGLGLAALLGMSACGGTAIDIELVPDPNVNDRATLLSLLSSFEVVIDNDDTGLYHNRDDRIDNLRIEDVDGDGAGELVATLGLPGDGRLPLVRLNRGELPDVPLRFDVDGFGDDSGAGRVRLAAGGVPGVRFADGEVVRIEVPFNIRPRYRPPRVTQLVPGPNTKNGQGTVGSVFVIFSKRMLRASIDGAAVGVYRIDGAGAGELVASVERNIQVIPGEDSPTTLQYVFSDPLGPGTYEVRVTAQARDEEQRSLDQLPMEKGDQAYAARFVVSDDPPPASVPTTPQTGPFDCTLVQCPGTTKCSKSNGRCELAQCPDACPDGTVCSDAFFVCVLDCRVHGSHGGCSDGKRCDAQTGLCVDN